MRKLITILLLALVTIAQAPLSAKANFFSFDIGGGIRQDKLKWSIASPDGELHTLSELSWHDIQSYYTSATMRYTNCYHIYFRGYADYGRIHHGFFHDKDFDADDAPPFISSRGKSNKGEVYDLSGGLGYQFEFLCGRVIMVPLVGYSGHAQHLRLSHLNVLIDEQDGLEGPIPGLHSNYRANWQGPWLGMDASLRMTRSLYAYATAEFHWARYHGSGHWNQRDDFIKDFKDRTSGYGNVYTLGFNYFWTCNWAIGVVGSYQNWWTTHGKQKTYFIDGPVTTRLNQVRWSSWSVIGQLSCHY